jgi:hypothetical protein
MVGLSQQAHPFLVAADALFSMQKRWELLAKPPPSATNLENRYRYTTNICPTGNLNI